MRYEIGVGYGYDRLGKPIQSIFASVILADALERAAQLFGGANLVKGVGSWKNDKGEIVVENSAVIIIDVDDSLELDRAALEFAGQLGRDLNQASVHFVRHYNATSNNFAV